MKARTILSVALAGALLAGAAFADDFGFDFGDDGGFDFGGEGASSGGIGAVLSAISLNGDASLEGRVYVDRRDDGNDRLKVGDFPTAVFPSLKLGIAYSGASTDFSGTIKLDRTSLGDGYYTDILDEFTARVYVNGNLQLEAGKMKVVWGKGDKLHVLDNFNANDYTDYIIPDYIDRRIAEPMFRAVYTTDGGIKFEGIYTPTMTGDRYASSGVWIPGKMTKAVDKLNAMFKAQGIDKEISLSDLDYPDTFAFKYGQAGIRSTFTLGPVDLGVSYYYGHNKQVSVDLSPIISKQSELPKLRYDRMQVFGLEAAAVLWKFNTRAEFAYNLTADTAGDDPWVKNNSIGWVVGFDIDLPLHNVNMNLQNQGSYVLRNDKIDDNTKKMAATTGSKVSDGDYDAKGRYSNNKLVLAVTDSWDHEKTKLDVKAIWGIERGDVIVLPKLTRTLLDGFDVSLSGMFIWCKDEHSEFDGWQHNSFVTVGARYQF
ncbi:MAG: hypothetical protein K2J81_03335 [Treponemataceae bacterium]|nr:hypothetical protein [Treponemataceae bacterium]